MLSQFSILSASGYMASYWPKIQAYLKKDYGDPLKYWSKSHSDFCKELLSFISSMQHAAACCMHACSMLASCFSKSKIPKILVISLPTYLSPLTAWYITNIVDHPINKRSTPAGKRGDEMNSHCEDECSDHQATLWADLFVNSYTINWHSWWWYLKNPSYTLLSI